MENKKYIVCLLDLERNREQRGIFFLNCFTPLHEVAMKLGISPRLHRLMGRRWEIHINEEPDNGGMKLLDCSTTVANLIKTLTDRLIVNNETMLIVPPNNPKGVRHATLPVLYDEDAIDLNPEGYLPGWDGE